MQDELLEVDHIIVSGVKKFQDDKELLEKLSALSNLDTNGTFANKAVDLETDQREDIKVLFSDKEHDRSLTFNPGDENGELNFYSYFDGDEVSLVTNLFTSIIDTLDETEIAQFHIGLVSDMSFTDFSFPFEGETSDYITGVKFTDSDDNFIFQSLDERTAIVYDRSNFTINEENVNDFIKNGIDRVRTFVGRFE